MIPKTILNVLEKKLGCSRIRERDGSSKSPLSQCFAYDTDKGNFFVKVLPSENIDAVAAESLALRLIDETKTVKVPKPFSYGYLEDQCFIVLEYFELREPDSAAMAALGEQLAEMHLHAAPERFGFEMDNTLGNSPQINGFESDWVRFFGEKRIRFQLELVKKRYGDHEVLEKGERLLERLPRFFEGVELYPSLLHGDLWGGNRAVDSEGNPIIFDPASYYGHHEAELGITTMFGGFSREFYDAYHTLIPKAEGFEERQRLYRLYHFLNHYNIFGEGYRGACLEILAHFD